MKNMDPKKLDITPSSGKNVRDTKMLSSLASRNAGHTAKNTITQHMGAGAPKDNLGGMRKG